MPYMVFPKYRTLQICPVFNVPAYTGYSTANLTSLKVINLKKKKIKKNPVLELN